jgi:hypothetical protein
MAEHPPAGSPPKHNKRKPAHRRWLLDGVRYALPTIVVLGGLVVMSFGDENHLEGGAGIVSAGLAIFFVNWLFRAGVSGDREREAEEAARDYFERHGRWPNG